MKPGREVDVVVVGGGVVGLSAARALARRRRGVLVLEQFRAGHDRGSSHGTSRIFRLAYDDPEWVGLAQEALTLWRELQSETGFELLTLSGSLDTGRDPGGLCAALERCDARFELLEPVECERRFGLRLPGPAVFQPEGGVAWAARTLEALRGPLEVLEDTRVLALDPDDEVVTVETSQGSMDARAAVVCAGAWARRLLEQVGIELPVRVTRETVAYVGAEREPLPSVIDWTPPEGRGVQAYALSAGEGRLKIGLHQAGAETDPDQPGRPDDRVAALAASWAARVLPLSAPEVLATETCLYTSTADENFVLERHGPIVVGSACSGHGFKFAPAVGRRLADLTEELLTS